MELILDLGDGLPPARKEIKQKEAPVKHSVAPVVQVLVPVAVAIAVTPVRCSACGAEHKNHLGIFIEHKTLSGGVVLKRVELKELPGFADLPRRVNIGPMEQIPICVDCWFIEQLFRESVLLAGEVA
jgi:hypothetical protein